jgi:digeranylgeranylglycerophospholipid reductase
MKYDAVIVGASIAGLSTAVHLVSAGWNVVVVDRRKSIGVPVRCGEATGNRSELSRFIAIDESWIACDIKGITAHVDPFFTQAQPIPDGGVMLHRDRFERSLAQSAAARGAKIVLDTPVTGLFSSGGRWGGVSIADGERIEASFIVGADGAESYVGRWAGITKNLGLNDIAATAHYRLASDFCNDGFLHFFVGESAIPFGYLWIFPKGDGMISVGGAGYRNAAGQPPVRHFVDRFIQNSLGIEPPRETMVCGAIPVVPSPRKLTKENVVVVGDAARQVNPLSGGGIMNALEASSCAARWLLLRQKTAWFRHKDTYSAGWSQNQRRQQKYSLFLREIWFSMPKKKIVHCLQNVFLLVQGRIDRSKPFTFPVGALFRFLLQVFPLALRHIRILFK